MAKKYNLLKPHSILTPVNNTYHWQKLLLKLKKKEKKEISCNLVASSATPFLCRYMKRLMRSALIMKLRCFMRLKTDFSICRCPGCPAPGRKGPRSHPPSSGRGTCWCPTQPSGCCPSVLRLLLAGSCCRSTAWRTAGWHPGTALLPLRPPWLLLTGNRDGIDKWGWMVRNSNP